VTTISLPVTVDTALQQDAGDDDDTAAAAAVVPDNELDVTPVNVPTTGDGAKLSYLRRRNTCNDSLSQSTFTANKTQ